MKDILEQTTAWIASEETIRLAILTGSRITKSSSDEFSDYDITLFCNDPEQLLKKSDWIKKIDQPMVLIPEKYPLLGMTIPTRLIIFQDGQKIDFSFFPIKALELIEAQGLPDALNIGYQVLIDKDRTAKKLPKATGTGFKEKRPSELQFYELIEEFWFEAYHVAKYLSRNDLWSAQFRLSGIHHRLLIKMICWSEAAIHNWDYTTHANGKNLQQWAREKTWDAARQIFSPLDKVKGWQALDKTATLFKRLSQEISRRLDYKFPAELEAQMSELIASFKQKDLSSQIVVRPYQEGDAKELAKIYYHTIHKINSQDYTEEQLNAWAPKTSLDPVDWAKKFKRTRPFVATAAGKIVGFAEFELNGHIDCFFCHHNWMGKGVGKALMEQILTKAAKQNLPKVFSEVSLTAKPFFEKYGFTVTHSQEVEMRGVLLLNFKMEKPLIE